MGICIGYKARLKDPAQLDEVLEEARGFCRDIGWDFVEYSERFSGIAIISAESAHNERDDEPEPDPDPEPWPEEPEGEQGYLRFRVSKRRPPMLLEETVRGIIATPPGTESVMLTFGPSGILTHYMDIPIKMVLNAIPGETHYVAWSMFTKTTGAIEVHIGICMLLRKLAKYMSELEVTDDTDFYGTGNLKKLNQEHAFMGAVIGLFKRPGMLDRLFRAAGLPGIGEDAKIIDLDKIHPALPPRPKPVKKKHAVM